MTAPPTRGARSAAQLTLAMTKRSPPWLDHAVELVGANPQLRTRVDGETLRTMLDDEARGERAELQHVWDVLAAYGAPLAASAEIVLLLAERDANRGVVRAMPPAVERLSAADRRRILDAAEQRGQAEREALERALVERRALAAARRVLPSSAVPSRVGRRWVPGLAGAAALLVVLGWPSGVDDVRPEVQRRLGNACASLEQDGGAVICRVLDAGADPALRERAARVGGELGVTVVVRGP